MGGVTLEAVMAQLERMVARYISGFMKSPSPSLEAFEDEDDDDDSDDDDDDEDEDGSSPSDN